MQHNVQLAIIGTGDPKISLFLRDVADKYPKKLAFFEGFSVRKAHMIEAGSDFFSDAFFVRALWFESNVQFGIWHLAYCQSCRWA